MFVLFTTAKVSKIFEKLTAFCLPSFFNFRRESLIGIAVLPFGYYYLDSLEDQLES